MRNAGASPLEFLYETLTHLRGLYDQGGSRKTLKANRTFKEGSYLVVDVQKSDGCYSMVSCYPVEGQKKPRGNELLIGGAVFRFSPSSEANPIPGGQPSMETASETAGTRGKAREGRIQSAAQSVNIHDVRVVDGRGDHVFTQERVPDISFSVVGPHAANREQQMTDAFRGSDAVEPVGEDRGVDMSASITVGGEEVDLRRCKATDAAGRALDADTFITTPNGSLDWFRFPQDERTLALLKKKGVPNVPVRLRVGRHQSDHNGFGFLHILNHFDDMRNAGASPLEFLYETLTHLRGLYDQGGSRKTLKANRTFKEGSYLVIDVQKSDGCYSMVSCYPVEGQKKPRGNELLIGGAVFRFTPNSEANPIESGGLTSHSTTVSGSESTRGKARETRIQSAAPSVNIHDVRVVDGRGDHVFTQERVPDISFSTFSPSEAEGLHALRRVALSGRAARFRSDTLGADVELSLGSAGKPKSPERADSKIVGAHGLLHLISMRMAHGESLKEAAYTAVKSVMAAVNGVVVEESSYMKKLYSDRYKSIIYLTKNGDDRLWVVTGYKDNNEHSSADDRRRAANLAESYAVDRFGRFEELGAALEFAIARLAREYKSQKGRYAVVPAGDERDAGSVSGAEPGGAR